MKKVLLLLFLSVILFNSSVNAQEYTVDANTVALWHFNEGSGNIAHDETGIHNGTINGATWASGRFGSALSFDSADDYVTTLNTDDLTFLNGNFTIEAWFKLLDNHQTGSSNKWILIKNGEYGLYLDGSDGYLKFYIASGHGIETSYKVSTKNNWTANTWYHVAGVYENGDTWKIYINGILDSSGNQSYFPMVVTCSLDIGNFLGCSFPHDNFVGTIDEVRISNVARSPSEFNLNITPTPPTTTTTTIPLEERLEQLEQRVEELESRVSILESLANTLNNFMNLITDWLSYLPKGLRKEMICNTMENNNLANTTALGLNCYIIEEDDEKECKCFKI